MFGCDSTVPLGVVMSPPPKMFGRDEERDPSGKVVSEPPKMSGVEEERPSGLVQSCPPKTFGCNCRARPTLVVGVPNLPVDQPARLLAAGENDRSRCDFMIQVRALRIWKSWGNNAQRSPSR